MHRATLTISVIKNYDEDKSGDRNRGHQRLHILTRYQDYHTVTYDKIRTLQRKLCDKADNLHPCWEEHWKLRVSVVRLKSESNWPVSVMGIKHSFIVVSTHEIDGLVKILYTNCHIVQKVQ